MELFVSVEVKSTEDSVKVQKAVENIFPSLDFKSESGLFSGIGKKEDLEVFKKHLDIQQICMTARSFLSSKIEDNLLEFDLNKQAAFMGKVNFVDFSMPLGTIKVKISGTDLQEVVNYLCY